MNTKPFFWESQANVEIQTLRRISLHVAIYYNIIFKSAKSQNQTFWAIEYWYKA